MNFQYLLAAFHLQFVILVYYYMDNGVLLETKTLVENIGAFCLRMRENRSVRLQMADFKGL